MGNVKNFVMNRGIASYKWRDRKEAHRMRLEKTERRPGIPFSLLTGILGGYLITVIGLFVLALLLLQLQLKKETVEIGILILYVLSVLAAGFMIGKLRKSRKFLWGMAVGFGYYFILFLLSVVMKRDLTSELGELLTTFLICIGGGMLGGMLS